jgi:hypothetical protein
MLYTVPIGFIAGRTKETFLQEKALETTKQIEERREKN